MKLDHLKNDLLEQVVSKEEALHDENLLLDQTTTNLNTNFLGVGTLQKQNDPLAGRFFMEELRI